MAFSLTCAAASEISQKGRFLSDSLLSDKSNSIKDAIQLKNSENSDDEAKSIDASLYNYNGNAVLALAQSSANALSWNDTQATTVAALGNAALILGGKQDLLDILTFFEKCDIFSRRFAVWKAEHSPQH